MNAVAWLSSQSFGAAPDERPHNTSASIVAHWRNRIASGALSADQVRAAEQIIAQELRGKTSP